MANLSVLSPGKWILDMLGKNIFRPIFDLFWHLDIFQKIRSGPLTLARQGSILAGAPTVQSDYRQKISQIRYRGLSWTKKATKNHQIKRKQQKTYLKFKK